MNTTFFRKLRKINGVSVGEIFFLMSGRNIERSENSTPYERNGVTYSSAKPNAFRLAKTMAVCPCINRRSGIIRINWNKLRYLSGLWNASHVMSASCFCSAIICNVILLGNEYSGEHFYL